MIRIMYFLIIALSIASGIGAYKWFTKKTSPPLSPPPPPNSFNPIKLHIPLTFFSRDILQLIISYVPYGDLHTFFRIHSIPYNINFKYNIIHHTFSKQHIIDLFHTFPNINLIGICCDNCDDYINNTNMMTQVHTARIVKLDGYEFYSLADSFEILNFFPSVTHLDIKYTYHTVNWSDLLKCKKLKKLIFKHCDPSIIIQLDNNFLNLHTIHWVHTNLYTSQLQQIATHPSLKTLHLKKFEYKYIYDDFVIFTNITTLKIINVINFKSFLKVLVFQKLQNLKFMDDRATNLDAFRNLTLCKLKVIQCPKLTCAAKISNLKLEKAIFLNCPNLINPNFGPHAVIVTKK